jgi:hypothetical protein|eukprot:CAMPEP_0174309974 /NCGR_PEP_ID=MMETSP0810-20121108/2761_1 /TAXON_ID=73025 ORGANISM="Eutreptiella gymnastica-like, Strain CCMP1594" /NCGR_SAMPLE_ID=MMETSP0810 /ASSEMBLY_ACC=CAM_ASM_000659 /LENGTH=57 /DNA_ID=CAMNT_0015417773 /DNA_START=1592 /DNA_END=1765 /DNA_ORIENTATION=+
MAHSGKAEPVAARGDGLLPVHLKPPLQARALGFVERSHEHSLRIRAEGTGVLDATEG